MDVTEVPLSPPLLAIILLAFASYLHTAVKWTSRTRGMPLLPGLKGLKVTLNAVRFELCMGYRDLATASRSVYIACTIMSSAQSSMS